MKNTMNPTVSIVVPVYNGEQFIRDALDSALAQDLGADKLELIVVDDGSIDGTCAIVQSYGDRVTLFKQENRGVSAARNYGVSKSIGSWIAFLDCDDVWESNKLSSQLADIGSCLWGYCDSYFLNGVNSGRKRSETTSMFEGMVLRQLILGNFIGTSGVIVNRLLFNKVGGFDERLRSVQDWDLWLRIAEHNAVCFTNSPLVYYRVHQNSNTRAVKKTLKYHLLVIEKIFSKGGVGEKFPGLYKRVKSDSYSICSLVAEEQKDYYFALKTLCYSIALSFGGSYRYKRLLKLIVFSIVGLVRLPK